MPAPYPLLDIPPGDIKDIFDFQAIKMAAAHNSFIQGINAIVAHAPHVPPEKVQPFMIFCVAVVATIHHHHEMEETFLFPEWEKKLGKGALSGNVDEHAQFVPQLEELEAWLKDVQAGKATYDGALLVQKIHAFSDTMLEHLHHEVPTLESSRMRAAFTEKELKDIDSRFMKIILKQVDFSTVMPLSLVLQNPATLWFPPVPAPVKWVTRLWFSRKYSEAWEFGPTDFHGNARKLPEIPTVAVA